VSDTFLLNADQKPHQPSPIGGKLRPDPRSRIEAATGDTHQKHAPGTDRPTAALISTNRQVAIPRERFAAISERIPRLRTAEVDVVPSG
jgi:hypothetical protein